MLQNIFAATVVACLLLAPGVLSQQCYNQSNCAGDVVSGPTTAKECCVGTDDGMSFEDSSGTCTVSQCIVHGFENVRYYVRERVEMEDGMEEEEGQDRVDTTFKFNVKGTTAFGGISLLGDITTEAGPNTEDSDFQSLTLNNRRATPTEGISIQLFSDNDAITLEYNDTVILRFTANLGLAPLISQLETEGEYIRDTAIVDIIDNDQLLINFRELDYVVNEGDQAGSIVLRFREVQNSFNLTLYPVTITEARDPDGFNVTAFVQPVTEDAQATPDADFNNTSVTITIPAGKTEYVIRNTFFFDDNINEIDQSFALVGELGDDVPEEFACFQRRTGDDLCFGRTGATTVKIEDNDDMIIGFRTNMTIRSEMLAEFSIDIHSRITSEVEYTIGFRQIRQGAVATVETSDTFDPIFDTDFDATFGDRPNPENAGDPLETTRILQVGHLEPLRSLRTTIFPDVRPEGNESYIISVFVIDTETGGGRVNYDCNDNANNPDDFFCDHTVFIVDDDDPFEVGYVQTIYTVIEDENPVRVCVNLTKPAVDIEEEVVFVESLDFNKSVHIPANATLATPDPFNFLTQSYEMIPFSDYEQQQLLSNHIRDIGINATRRVICYDQLIYDDLRLEPAEYFGMTLTVQGMPPTTVLTEVRPMYGEVAILIVDDDEAVVGLEKTFYSITEDVGVIEACVIVYSPTINCPIEFPFDVRLLTRDGSAESPMDYIGLSTILSFPACETKQCVDVTIVDDDVLENVESFSVSLEGPGQDTRTVRSPDLYMRIRLHPMYGSGVAEITDNGDASVGLEQTIYQVSEGDDVVEVCAIVYEPNGNLDCPISFPFHVSLLTGDDSAVASLDYHGVSTILMFEACERQRCVNVTIVDDDILEMTESFHVTLERTPGLDMRIRLDQVDGVVEITDDDETMVGLEKTFYNVTEDVGVVEVCAIVYSPTIDCPINFTFAVRLSARDGSAVSPMDYNAMFRDLLNFPACGTKQCVDVVIVDDDVLENVESFHVTLGRTPGLDTRIRLSLVDGIINIIDDGVQPPTPVIVNDTLTGDPLMTVPILTDPNVEEGDDIISLCYEVHGEADKFFNLVSDSCVTVNAHYSKAPIPGPGVDLNVVDAIGVRAVSNTGDCLNIHVGLQGCNTTLNGAVISMYRSNGITVRKYSNRVRMSVPNCGDTDLVMWAFCTSGRTEDLNLNYHDFDFIRFVVMRGLNLAEESHGIMGQFWNIPVDVAEHLDDFNGVQRDDDYNITVNYPGSTPRSFVGIFSTVTWEFEKRPCLYVGNSQAGPLGEDVVPNDSVIEGEYGDYEVDSMFASNFIFSHFEESRC